MDIESIKEQMESRRKFNRMIDYKEWLELIEDRELFFVALEARSIRSSWTGFWAGAISTIILGLILFM